METRTLDDTKLDIIRVAYMCGLNNLKTEGPRFTTVCPFCGAKSGHFYLTPQDPKDTRFKNVYKCIICGESGSSTRLYAKLHNLGEGPEGLKQAYKEIMGYDTPSNIEYEIKKIKKNAEKNKVKLNPLAPLLKRDYVYRFLIENLHLSEENFNNLFSRGLNEEEIVTQGYVTLPKDFEFKKNLCNRIIKKGISLKGIPGFYRDRYKNWTFWTPKEGGFLVPVRDMDFKIQGCQIRKNVGMVKDKDNVKKAKKKYPWFSSSYMNDGCQSGGFFHVHWNKNHSVEKIVMTEGPLKADVASYLSDYTFLAYAGVGSYNGSAEILKKMGAKKIIIANDMDKYKNKYVMNHEKNFKKYLKKNGFTFKPAEWPHEYKGIDDYLYHITFE